MSITRKNSDSVRSLSKNYTSFWISHQKLKIESEYSRRVKELVLFSNSILKFFSHARKLLLFSLKNIRRICGRQKNDELQDFSGKGGIVTPP